MGALGLVALVALPGAASASSKQVVNVYTGRQVMASGVTLAIAVTKVQPLAKFPISVPTFLPSGLIALQVNVTPRIVGISSGSVVLSFGGVHGGFVLQETLSSIAHVGGTSVKQVRVNGRPAVLREFKGTGEDLLMLTGALANGVHYDLTTNAVESMLTASTVEKIAASLK